MKGRFARIVSNAVATLLLASAALAAETTTTFKVTGMYCNACETKIQQALNKMDGVQSAAVSLDKGSATVTYDDAKVKPDQLVKVIEKEGYKAEPQQRKGGCNKGPGFEALPHNCRSPVARGSRC